MDEAKLKRLGRAIETSYRGLESFRLLNSGLVKEFAGPGYGTAGDEINRQKYLNLMNQAIEAYMMLLSANVPRVLTTAKTKAYSGFATHLKTALNNLLVEIEFHKTHTDWVLDAFFCVGVVKIHMADTGEIVAEDDILMDPGTPFVSNISIDDWVYDKGATKLTRAKFMGDMYRIAFEELKNEQYDQEVVAELSPTSKQDGSGERLEQISVGTEVDDDEFEPMIDLADIYIASEKKVYTFAVTNRRTFTIDPRPLMEYDWVGTEKGPYRDLGFSKVPKNIMPVGPASQLIELDKLINNLMRKQSRQAHRQKENPVYTPAGADDARSLRNAGDGEWIKVQDPREVNVIRQGGADPGNQNFMLNSMELFDRMAGNLPALLGLGASSDTVGQEKLIHGAASRKEGQMSRIVFEATLDVIRELAFLLWNDKFKTIPGELTIDGFPGYSAESNWTPDDREGEFRDYQIDIDVHSLAYQSPGERVGAIMGLLERTYIPMMQVLEAQGGTIDFSELTDILSELLNLPRLKDVVVFTAPIAEQEAGGGMTGPSHERSMPASTQRSYVRQDAGSGPRAVPQQTAVPQQQQQAPQPSR